MFWLSVWYTSSRLRTLRARLEASLSDGSSWRETAGLSSIGPGSRDAAELRPASCRAEPRLLLLWLEFRYGIVQCRGNEERTMQRSGSNGTLALEFCGLWPYAEICAYYIGRFKVYVRSFRLAFAQYQSLLEKHIYAYCIRWVTQAAGVVSWV